MIDPKVYRLAVEILRQHTSTFMTMLEAVKIARQLIRDQERDYQQACNLPRGVR
jgi:hypothetical protein